MQLLYANLDLPNVECESIRIREIIAKKVAFQSYTVHWVDWSSRIEPRKEQNCDIYILSLCRETII